MNKQLAAAAGAILVLTMGGTYWKMKNTVPAYTVARVIDGDTFETKEKQLIRLAHVDAPEKDLCMGEEAKKKLESLVLNRPVYLKVIYRDKFMRLISLVYTPDAFVNEEMTKSGLAVYILSGKSDDQSAIIKEGLFTAVKNNAGVYGPEYTQKENPVNKKCNIKGNIRNGGDGKMYSLPECESYGSTIVQLHLGDRWFCNEKEAIEAGFKKAGGCNSNGMQTVMSPVVY